MTLFLAPKPGSKKKRKRIGRGNSSGHGTYSGRGIKGQLARKGGSKPAGFEGGQTPLIRRVPKKHGFKNPNRIPAQIINVCDLNKLADGALSKELLKEKRLIRNTKEPVKILGDGELKKKFAVPKEILVSTSAKEKIINAGGTVEETEK